MSERPTPETNAFSIQLKTICGQKKWVPVDFARQLERSRDEWAAMCGRYKQERDEAREAFIIATDQMVLAQCKLREANMLAQRAKELVARWDQPPWKDTAPTAGFIYALRDAVNSFEEKKTNE